MDRRCTPNETEIENRADVRYIGDTKLEDVVDELFARNDEAAQTIMSAIHARTLGNKVTPEMYEQLYLARMWGEAREAERATAQEQSAVPDFVPDMDRLPAAQTSPAPAGAGRLALNGASVLPIIEVSAPIDTNAIASSAS